VDVGEKHRGDLRWWWGIPTMYERARTLLTGIEAVIDKDLASELLARELEADLL